MVGTHVRVDELAADTVVVRDDELVVATMDVGSNGVVAASEHPNVVYFGMIE